MTDPSKIKPTHTQRAAYVYIRQSTPGQVEHNRESTARQYALAERACQLGWPKQQVVIVDEDLGLSGSSTDKRSGFARLTSEVALAAMRALANAEIEIPFPQRDLHLRSVDPGATGLLPTGDKA